MKILVRNSHNRAEGVITRAEEELALAKLIKHGADRDLVQIQKTIDVTEPPNLYKIKYGCPR